MIGAIKGFTQIKRAYVDCRTISNVSFYFYCVILFSFLIKFTFIINFI